MNTQTINQSGGLPNVSPIQQKMPVQGAAKANLQSSGMDRVEISQRARTLSAKQSVAGNTQAEQAKRAGASEAAPVREQARASKSAERSTLPAENQTKRDQATLKQDNSEQQARTNRNVTANAPAPTGNTQNGARLASVETRSQQLQTQDMEQTEKRNMQLAQTRSGNRSRMSGNIINEMA